MCASVAAFMETVFFRARTSRVEAVVARDGRVWICLVFCAEGGGGGIEIGSVLHVASAISALSLLDVVLRRAVGRTAVRRALIRAIAAGPLQRRI